MLACTLAGSAALLGAGCGDARSLVDDPRVCPTWADDIGPLLAQKCTSCHSGDQPAGKYDLSSYNNAISVGANGKQRALPGDASSLLLQTLDPATADDVHKGVAGVSDVLARLNTWVVACKLPVRRTLVHPPGILDPVDPDFHGQLLKSTGWKFSVCQKCHGADLKGGGAGVSCYTCHAKGPTDCNTCHGQPPMSGAHTVHLSAAVTSQVFDCVECHQKPAHYDDVGHLFDADGGVLPETAQLRFGSAALTSGVMPDHRAGPPSYDATTKTCTNVYCHGATFQDTKASGQSPKWEASASFSGKCDSCHGKPPSSHGSSRCLDCHQNALDATAQKPVLAKHLDGKISIGDESGECWACHGTRDSGGAPPKNLYATPAAEAANIVGLHAQHLHPKWQLRGPMACGECHVPVKDLHDPGHIDHEPPAQVFPTAQKTYQGIAAADGAPVTWDRTTWTCANVYCHGGGKKIGSDTTPGLTHTLSWTTADDLQVRCGGCHGIPPKTVDANGKPHPTTGLGSCYTCHPQTVDANGNIIISGAPGAETSTHINGLVETITPP